MSSNMNRLKFSVGPLEVPSFRMIERHYFKGKLLRNYDFTFGFCIPNSTNTWEAIYDMPENSPKTIEEMVSSSASSSNHSNTHTGALSRRSINDFWPQQLTTPKTVLVFSFMMLQISSPDEHISDTFYFVEDRLIMHNKAYFKYVWEREWMKTLPRLTRTTTTRRL